MRNSFRRERASGEGRDAMPEGAATADPLTGFEARLRKFNRILTTKAAIAHSPKETVWALNKARLYRYTPVASPEKRHRIPLLLVFAIMNRPSILDLRPGHSFVEFMIGQGFDVYLLDWGVPGYEDRHLQLDDYALEYLPRAIRKLKAIAGTDEFSLLGWCIGALITTIYAARLPDGGLRNLLLLTAPLDFSNRAGLTFARWTDERYFDVDKILTRFGNMPGEMIDYGARALKPVENYIASFCKLWDNLDDPQAVEAWPAMNTWVTDTIPMAGGAYRQLIVELYRKNALVNNKLIIRDKVVELAEIKANLLAVIAATDHITPPCQSETILDKVSSRDKEAFRIPGGHIGIMAGSSAQHTTWPHIAAWLKSRSR
jgi:poly[(R)-3-hydroxyalkanoate] polymerase subunit PhaC